MDITVHITPEEASYLCEHDTLDSSYVRLYGLHTWCHTCGKGVDFAHTSWRVTPSIIDEWEWNHGNSSLIITERGHGNHKTVRVYEPGKWTLHLKVEDHPWHSVESSIDSTLRWSYEA
jgi:hypothetical protein